MKITELNFRQLADNYVLFSDINEKEMLLCKQDFPYEEGDNVLLTYGYIDVEAGLSFEVLAFGQKLQDGSIIYREGNPTVTVKLRYREDMDVETVEYDERFDAFQETIDMLDQFYGASSQLNMIRQEQSFDEFRYNSHPDDVNVLMIAGESASERVWVRTRGLVDGVVIGTLLNQPYSDAFGLNEGDTVRVYPARSLDGELTLVTDQTLAYLGVNPDVE